MSDISFKVEAEVDWATSADDVAAATSILKDYFDRAFPHARAQPMPTQVWNLDEELTQENLLAHLVWQKNRYPRVEQRSFPQWLLIITAPLAPLLMSFMTEAGKDAWRACKDLFTSIRQKRRHPDPAVAIRIRDVDSGVTVDLRSLQKQPLPDRAWQELITAGCAMPVLPPSCIEANLVWDDTSSFLISLSSLVHDEAEAPDLRSDLSETQDHWVLRMRLSIAAYRQQSNETRRRRWLGRHDRIKGEAQGPSVTIELVWQASDCRWMLPRQESAE